MDVGGGGWGDSWVWGRGWSDVWVWGRGCGDALSDGWGLALENDSFKALNGQSTL